MVPGFRFTACCAQAASAASSPADPTAAAGAVAAAPRRNTRRVALARLSTSLIERSSVVFLCFSAPPFVQR